MHRFWWPAALALLASWAGARGAAAQGRTPEMEQARTLALEAADLLDQKQLEQALERAKRAEELFHAPTHLLMIAEAQEGLGRLAEALDTFERLAAEPLSRGAPVPFRKAREEAERRVPSLVARVPSLLVVVHGPEPSATKVAVDGVVFDAPPGVATRLDPGDHLIRVEADGFGPAERTVKLPDKGGVVRLEIALSPARARAAAAAPAPRAAGAAGQRATEGGSLVPAFVAFGAGAVGAAVGAVTGAMSLGRVSDLQARCPGGRCGPAEQDDIDDAEALGNASTAGFAVGAAGAAAGVVLLLIRKPAPAGPRRAGAGRQLRGVTVDASGLRVTF